MSTLKPAASNKFALAATNMLQQHDKRNTIEVSRNDNTMKHSSAQSIADLSNISVDDYTQKKTIVIPRTGAYVE